MELGSIGVEFEHDDRAQAGIVLRRVVNVAVRQQPARRSNKSIEHLRRFDRIQECYTGLSNAMFKRRTSRG
jgi:hypothetical protein